MVLVLLKNIVLLSVFESVGIELQSRDVVVQLSVDPNSVLN